MSVDKLSASVLSILQINKNPHGFPIGLVSLTITLQKTLSYIGSVPSRQPESRFFDRKLDFSFHPYISQSQISDRYLTAPFSVTCIAVIF